jgi:hypothetical protein
MKRKVGTSWRGTKYIHGPRLKSPRSFSEFRLGKPNKKGIRMVFGKNKKTGEWELQSKLTPRSK